MKKTGFLILCIFLCAVFCSCSQEEEESYGTIQDVDIPTSEQEIYEEDKIFSESKDDLGYEYKEVDAKRAEMKFQVPQTWEVKVVNQRLIQLQAPQTDPKLPGVTINIQHGLNPLGEYDKNTPDEFEQLFETERKQMTYNIEGDLYYQSYMGTPSRVVAHSEITKDVGLLSMHIYENAPLFHHHNGSSPPYPCTAFYSYIKWQQLPTCFSLVCDNKNAADAEALLTYITSTIKLSKAKIGSTKVEEVNKVHITVPNDFERIEEKGSVVLRPSMKAISYFSGSAVTVVNLEAGFENNLTGKGSIGESICKQLLGGQYQYVLGYWGGPEQISLGGSPATLYYYTCDIFGSCELKDPMPPVLNSYFYLYCFDNGGKTKALALLTSATPENAIVALGNLIEERTKI